jgi:hypothetical protein
MPRAKGLIYLNAPIDRSMPWYGHLGGLGKYER